MSKYEQAKDFVEYTIVSLKAYQYIKLRVPHAFVEGSSY